MRTLEGCQVRPYSVPAPAGWEPGDLALKVIGAVLSKMVPEVLGLFICLFPGRVGLVWGVGSLSSGRLPLNEDDHSLFPSAADGTYRTLWFSEAPSDGDRIENEQYLYGWDGKPKDVVDIKLRDGDEFFRLLHWYFSTNDPYGKLAEIESVTESYKRALIENFSLEEVLSEISTVERHDNWTRRDSY